MDRRHNRKLFVVAVAGVFCLLITSGVSAQTATNLDCFKCVGAGEVANNTVSWLNLDGPARAFLINQANDVNGFDARVDALEAQVAALEALVATLQADGVPNLGTYLRIGTHNGQPAALFEAVNVMVVNGTGTTQGATNGLGNLIVGYDEYLGQPGDNKSGSHNLVVGPQHNYSSIGGFVAGNRNNVLADHATVSGGQNNTASGEFSSVSGGDSNIASGFNSSVSGGRINTASGAESSVSGGNGNIALGTYSSVSGGIFNTASGVYASVSGGSSNIAVGGSVSGGSLNQALAPDSSVSGGTGNIASGMSSSVSGGNGRNALADDDWVAGTLFEDN